MTATRTPLPRRGGGVSRRDSLAILATLTASTTLGSSSAQAATPDPVTPVSPERFMLGSDKGHGIAFQRMIDWLQGHELLDVMLPPGLYDISDTPLVISSPLQIRGAGFFESGREGTKIAGGPSEPMIGTRIKANCRSAPAITITGGRSRGASIDGIAFEQDHPAPGQGWAPIDYHAMIEVENTLGAVHFGRVAFVGVNRIANFRTCGRISISAVAGQAFRSGLVFDDCQDIVAIELIDLWDFWSSDRSVGQFTQSNLESLVIGRADGMEVGMFFSLWSKIGLHMIKTRAGGPTSIHFDYFFADGTTCPFLSEAPNAESYFDFFRGQCEASNGQPLPSSMLVHIAAGASGGIYDFGRLAGDYFSRNAIRNDSNSAVTIYRPGKFSHFPEAEALWHSPIEPLKFLQREISDRSGPAGQEREVARGLDTYDAVLPGPFDDDANAARQGVRLSSAYRRNDGIVAWRRH